MTSKKLLLLASAAALAVLAGPATADTSRVHTQQPSVNFAEKPGCGMYNSCGRIEAGVLGLTRATRQVGSRQNMHEALGNAGYRRGYGTFNVLDSIR